MFDIALEVLLGWILPFLVVLVFVLDWFSWVMPLLVGLFSLWVYCLYIIYVLIKSSAVFNSKKKKKLCAVIILKNCFDQCVILALHLRLPLTS